VKRLIELFRSLKEKPDRRIEAGFRYRSSLLLTTAIASIDRLSAPAAKASDLKLFIRPGKLPFPSLTA
jgi:hypothetical protein